MLWAPESQAVVPARVGHAFLHVRAARSENDRLYPALWKDPILARSPGCLPRTTAILIFMFEVTESRLGRKHGLGYKT